MWISTDGQPDALGFNDGFYAVPVDGPDRGHLRMFASVPLGAEATGPAFTPDGTIFFAAVQHPGEGGSIAQPLSDWPDRAQPPTPSVIAIGKLRGDPRVPGQRDQLRRRGAPPARPSVGDADLVSAACAHGQLEVPFCVVAATSAAQRHPGLRQSPVLGVVHSSSVGTSGPHQTFHSGQP